MSSSDPRHDDEPDARPSAETPYAAWIAGVVAAVVGLIYGYDFGARLDGLWLGLVTSLSTGAFGFLFVSSVVERLAAIGSRRRKPD
jgi:hypothetical protein